MKTPKYQKGSQIKAALEAQIAAGSLSPRDARRVKKGLAGIKDDLYYFKNSDGTYSVMKEDPTQTAEDGSPVLETTLVDEGLDASDSKLSLARLKRGDRKLARAMGAASALGELGTYVDYAKQRKEAAAKAKAEEEKKKKEAKQGNDANLTSEDLKTMTMQEQDEALTQQVNEINPEDVKYKTVSADEAEVMYKDLSQLETTTNADGETAYKVPYAKVGGAGASEEFALIKDGDSWIIGSPFPNKAEEARIKKAGEQTLTFSGTDPKQYQTYLAKLLQQKIESGEITDQQLADAGVNKSNLFNAKTGTDVTYAEIISQMSGDGSVSRDPGPDGEFGTDDDTNYQPTKLTTKVDGQLGSATSKLESVLGVTRPSGLVKAKKNKTGEENWLKELLVEVKGMKVGGRVPKRKKGGIVFNILNNRLPN